MSTRRLDNVFVLEREFGKHDLKFRHKRLRFVSDDVSKFKVLFINSLIKQGKKLRAEYWVHSLLVALKRHMRIQMSHFDVFTYALVRLRPLVGFRRFKLGRTLYYLPMWLRDQKKRGMAVRYLLRAARDPHKGSGKNISMEKVLELFLFNVLHKDNVAFQYRVDFHKIVKEGMAFVRFLKWL
jgi:ribosomal protein S7